MKKIIIISIIALIILAVGISEAAAMSDAESKSNDILKKNNTNGKVLVVYFSKTGENYNVGEVEVGNTAMMASYIKEYLNADSFEIVPVNPYPDDYKETTDQASKEQSDNARPEIKNRIDNFDNYDTIFIGYPIWWGDLPNIMYTFLEQYDFNGKTVIPFNTHEGSGDAGTYQTIASQLPEAKVNTDGLAIDGKTARTEYGKQHTIEWLKGLGF
ncbi:flavodoxin [Methanobrevibacter sp.]|uniref:flavodoxin n=1 Tax=Methanobrevibacter sp. TaxID=66852 RepID=UPI0038901F9E